MAPPLRLREDGTPDSTPEVDVPAQQPNPYAQQQASMRGLLLIARQAISRGDDVMDVDPRKIVAGATAFEELCALVSGQDIAAVRDTRVAELEQAVASLTSQLSSSIPTPAPPPNAPPVVEGQDSLVGTVEGAGDRSQTNLALNPRAGEVEMGEDGRPRYQAATALGALLEQANPVSVPPPSRQAQNEGASKDDLVLQALTGIVQRLDALEGKGE